MSHSARARERQSLERRVRVCQISHTRAVFKLQNFTVERRDTLAADDDMVNYVESSRRRRGHILEMFAQHRAASQRSVSIASINILLPTARGMKL